jgi:threonine/homoserine/homoserine lactone efflux protein
MKEVMDNILTFIIASFLIEATPGPNMGYLAITSVHKGKKAGFSLTAGIFCGLLIIGLLVATGIGTIVKESPTAYQIIRYIGIAYMLWLAWDTWKEPMTQSFKDNKQDYYRIYFIRGFFTNILNPKAILFYAIMLPTFTNVEGNLQQQIYILTILFVGIATMTHALVVIMAGQFEKTLKNSKKQKNIRQIMALLLLCVAIWFAWSTRI